MSNKQVAVDEIQATDKSPTHHFAIYYPLKKARDVKGQKVTAPDPHGISGCGVWKVRVDSNTGALSKPSLVGIGIEYLKSYDAMVATRIGCVTVAQKVLNQGAD